EEQTADYNKIREIQAENESLQQRTNKALESGGNLVKETAENMERLKKAIPHAGDLNFKELADINNFIALDEKQLEKDFAELIKNTQQKIDSSDTSFVNIPIKLDFATETLSPEAQKELDEIVNRQKQKEEELKRTWESLGGQLQNTLAGAFEQSMLSGDDFFKSFAEGFKKMLAQMAAQLAASAVIKFLGF